MTQLVQKRNFKKTFAFFYRPPSWIIPKVHCTAVTDDSRMKDVLQLTTAIVMASSAKQKVWLQKFKNN